MVDLNLIINMLFTAFILYFFVINTIYLVVLFLSILQINRMGKYHYTQDLDQAFRFRLLPPVTIILPAYNEEKTIVESVTSLLFIKYPSYELLVVNDGSKDKTLEVLIDSFNLVKTDYVYRSSIDTEEVQCIYISKEYRSLVVIDKKNGGKADALNAGINISRYPYFCAIDADSILGEDALARLIMPFVHDPVRTTAVGGIVKAANGADIVKGRLLRERMTWNPLVIFQTVEYARSFFMGRMGLSVMNSLLIISGAFGLFRKEDVLKVHGYRRKSLGEDMLLVVSLHKQKLREKSPYRIGFLHDTVCWTEIPSDLRTLKKQRVRWQMGLMESLTESRNMFFNPRYGAVGLFSIPFYFFSEIIPPFLEFMAYAIMGVGLYVGALNLQMLFHFFLVSWLYSAVHSFVGLATEYFMVQRVSKFHHFLLKLCLSCFENLFYRQINLVYRIAGFFKYFSNKREWGEMERKGFT
jgi:cellulose synthase/poly-beta-1,6-N-acetylglucosamine synthase-like glycosyltransferase